MHSDYSKYNSISRRTVLRGAAAGAALMAAPTVLSAAGHSARVRPNMVSDEGKAHLETYRKAVANMLTLPADDPHNWYRYAMIHLMDCPHGNWWFFVWHRPYVANLEQIVRLHGGDENFMMPYWDWTAQPYIDTTMLNTPDIPNNALDPTSDHYMTWDAFADKFHDTTEAFWNSLTPDQRDQEAKRGYPDWDSFWTGNPMRGTGVQPNFTANPAVARSKSLTFPDLTYPATDDVKFDSYKAGLLTPKFTTEVGVGKASTGFNSPQSANHHQGVGSALIEGHPHNNVHNNLGSSAGGWMPSLLSPVDPIFFLHHCNVDRLWSVWIDRQIERGNSFLPTAAEAPDFNPEPFLFYVNADRQEAPGTAGDYMDPASWDYTYTPGTGSELVQDDKAQFVRATPNVAAQAGAPFDRSASAAATLELGEDVAEAAMDDQSRQIAHITIDPPTMLTGVSFDVFVSPAGSAPDLNRDSAEFAGSFEFFGMAHSHGSVVFSIDVTRALDRLTSEGALEPGAAIDVAVASFVGEDAPEMALENDGSGILKDVTLETI